MPIVINLIGGWPSIHLASWLPLEIRLAILIEIDISGESDLTEGYLRFRSTLHRLECDIYSTSAKPYLAQLRMLPDGTLERGLKTRKQ